MPRVKRVEKSRARAEGKPPRKCGKCGAVIPVGDPYIYTKLKLQRGGQLKVRCTRPACAFTPADLTNSPYKQADYHGSHALALASAAAVPEDAAGYLREAMEFAEELRDLARAAMDGWSSVDGFQQNEAYYTMESLVSEADSFIDDAEEVASELEGMDARPGEEFADCSPCDGCDDCEDECDHAEDPDCEECPDACDENELCLGGCDENEVVNHEDIDAWDDAFETNLENMPEWPSFTLP